MTLAFGGMLIKRCRCEGYLLMVVVSELGGLVSCAISECLREVIGTDTARFALGSW